MRLLVAGGGTGGHLFPGIAVAEEIVRRGGQVMFVGTSRGLEARAVPAAGYPLELLEVSGLKRMSLGATIRGLWRLPKAFLRSWSILRRFRPDVVLGVGGYASGPMVLAAALLGYPSAIQEQNSVPGITNRILSRLVRVVMVAFVEAGNFFPANKVESTGNPVRAKLCAALTSSSEPGPQTRILVVGGSQGARAVNDLVMAAVEILAKQGRLPAMVHQTGPGDLDRCSERYHSLGVTDHVEARAFIDDMASAYQQASLVVGRAGALTLAELALAARPAILIPLPTAADDHQNKNAAHFAKAGAAVVLDQKTATGAQLAELLGTLAADPARRQVMAAAMRTLAQPQAAATVADRLEALTRKHP
jgi:UDP-N-acetylglucosamine--N-acetylmuramyl-(pentapeptide) pyrophosphoryl-undecaprenol N-acetylglucosamine transferase